MGNIKVILKYGELIKVDNNLFLCNYKNWIIKIREENDKRHEIYLYYNGIYLSYYMVDKTDIDLSNYDILQGMIEKDNSCML